MRRYLASLLLLCACGDDGMQQMTPDAAPRPYVYAVTIHGHGAVAIAGQMLQCAQDVCTGQLDVDPFGGSGEIVVTPESADWALTGETIDAMPIFLAANSQITPGDHTVDVVFTTLPSCTPIAVLPQPPSAIGEPEYCVGHTFFQFGSNLAHTDGSGACAYLRADQIPAANLANNQVTWPIPMDYPPGEAIFLDRTYVGMLMKKVLIVKDLPAPMPTMISPTTATPGTRVTVTGTNMGHVLHVLLNDNPCLVGSLGVYMLSDTTIQFDAPDAPNGTYSIVAYTACGRASTTVNLTITH